MQYNSFPYYSLQYNLNYMFQQTLQAIAKQSQIIHKLSNTIAQEDPDIKLLLSLLNIQQKQHQHGSAKKKKLKKNGSLILYHKTISPSDILIQKYYFQNPQFYITSDFGENQPPVLTTVKRFDINIKILDKNKQICRQINNMQLSLLLYDNDSKKPSQLHGRINGQTTIKIKNGQGIFRQIKIFRATNKDCQGQLMNIVIILKKKKKIQDMIEDMRVQSLVIKNIEVKTKFNKEEKQRILQKKSKLSVSEESQNDDDKVL